MSWSRSARPRRRPAPPRPASPRPPRPSDDWPGGPVPPDPRRDAHVPGAAPPGGRVAHVDHAASRLRYGHRAEFAIGRLELVGNTGTYLDSPFHRYPDGPDVSALPLNHLVDLPTVVVDARAQAAADRRLDLVLACAGPLAGRAVLIRADWDERWGTQAYWQPGPYLGQVMIDRLVHARPALVGVDCWNVDDHALVTELETLTIQLVNRTEGWDR